MTDLPQRIAELEAENAELRGAAVEALPARYWARYDLSAARVGWALARGEVGRGNA